MSKIELLLEAERRGLEVPPEMQGLLSEARRRNLIPPSMDSGTLMDPLHQGLTFGWADELGGIGARVGHWLASMTGNVAPGREGMGAEVQAKETARQRENLAAVRERQPYASAATELAGSLVSGAPIAKGVNTLRGLVGVGALEGAIGGAGSADENKLAGAALGGTIGAGLSAAIPLTIAGTGNVGRWAQDKVAPIVNRLRESPETAANRMLMESLESEGITPAILRSRYRQYGPDTTLSDVGGAKVEGLSQGVIDASKTGDELALARKTFGARKAKSTGRIQKDLQKATGVKDRMLTVVDEVSTRQKALSKSAYDNAYKYQMNYADPKLVDLINRPSVRSAIASSLKNAADEGRKVPALEKITLLGDDVRIGSENMPDMKAWDEIKRTLDRMVSNAYRNDAVNKNTLKNLRNEVRDTLSRLNPEYKKAREIYAGPAAVMSAIEEGEKFLNRKTREVAEFLRGTSQSEKQGYLVGAMEAIREKMGRARSGEIGEFRFLELGNTKEKLRMLFPKGKEGTRQMQQIMRTLNRERQFAMTQGRVIENSQTALRQAGGRMVKGQADIPTMAEIAANPIRGSIGAGIQAGKEALSGLSDKSIGELGKLLFTPDNVEVVIAELQKRGLPPQAIQSLLDRVKRSGAVIAPAAGMASGALADEL